MGKDKHRECAAVGDFPPDYSKLLPHGVPPSETPPADKTWYFPIRLAMTNPTGVYIPEHFTFNKENPVDVILFFHGNDAKTITINVYWSGNYIWSGDDKNKKIFLRENLNTSRKNALLVAPTMGRAPGHSLDTDDLGIFKDPGGGDCFLDHVMQWLGKYDTRFAIKPKVGKVVLAGHSGGGNAIHNLIRDTMKAQICEVWCFDIVLGDLDDWIIFAHANPTTPIFFFYTTRHSKSFEYFMKQKDAAEKRFKVKLDNMTFKDVGNDHFRALTDNFLPQLNRKGSCLSSN